MGKKAGERRGSFRVPMAGNICWRSDRRTGECRLLDISPGGAAFEVPAEEAFRIGPKIRLDMKLTDEIEWCVSERAQVVRRVARAPDRCQISVEFAPSYGW